VPSITITSAAEQLSATQLTFGSQPRTTLSGSEPVAITNTGSAPLTISSWSFIGSDADDFIVGSSTCGRPLAPSASCQLGVRFVPQAAGARSAMLQIGSDQVTAANVTLSGTGGALPQGAGGRRGPAGKVELVTCKIVTVKHHHRKSKRRRCTVKLVSRPVKFTAAGGR
jgi:hypothetical protein